jgi:hypothetical protein
MNKQQQQRIQVDAAQSSLMSTLTRFLKMERESSDMADSALVREEVDLFDFGVKLKVLALQNAQTQLRVSIPGWKDIQDVATDRLRAIYGNSFLLPSHSQRDEAFDFMIKVDEAVKKFDSIESCAASLAQIRIQTIGAPILKALENIVLKDGGQGSSTKETVYRLDSYPKSGICHCFGTEDK